MAAGAREMAPFFFELAAAWPIGYRLEEKCGARCGRNMWRPFRMTYADVSFLPKTLLGRFDPALATFW